MKYFRSVSNTNSPSPGLLQPTLSFLERQDQWRNRRKNKLLCYNFEKFPLDHSHQSIDPLESLLLACCFKACKHLRYYRLRNICASILNMINTVHNVRSHSNLQFILKTNMLHYLSGIQGFLWRETQWGAFILSPPL